MVRTLMKSNGGSRGVRELPSLERDPARRPGWVPVDEALPEPVPGYRASLGYQLRFADGTVGFGHWRPAGEETSGPWRGETWEAAWIDADDHRLDPPPVAWWRSS